MLVKCCAASELAVGHAIRVDIDDVPVALIKDSAGRCFAIGDTCSHADVSLSEGDVEGNEIECWGHGATFDFTSGEALSLPAVDPVPVYRVEIIDGDVYVDTSVLVPAE